MSVQHAHASPSFLYIPPPACTPKARVSEHACCCRNDRSPRLSAPRLRLGRPSLRYPYIAVGKISLQEAVSKRQGISKVQTVILDALAAGKVAATPGPEETGNVEGRKEGVARIQMSNVKNPSQSVTLEVDIRVRRRPLHPVILTFHWYVIRIGRHERVYSCFCLNFLSSLKAQC